MGLYTGSCVIELSVLASLMRSKPKLSRLGIPSSLVISLVLWRGCTRDRVFIHLPLASQSTDQHDYFQTPATAIEVHGTVSPDHASR